MTRCRCHRVCDTAVVRLLPVAVAAAVALGTACAKPGSDPIDAPADDDGSVSDPDAGVDAPTAAFAVQYADPDQGPFRG